MSDRLRNEYEAAIERYASCCRAGGTKEERAWAFARAMDGLEKLMLAEPANAETQEVEAV